MSTVQTKELPFVSEEMAVMEENYMIGEADEAIGMQGKLCLTFQFLFGISGC